MRRRLNGFFAVRGLLVTLHCAVLTCGTEYVRAQGATIIVTNTNDNGLGQPQPTVSPVSPAPTATATATAVATPSATATPTVTPGFFRVFWEGFDSFPAPALPPGWTTSFVAGPADCINSGTCPLGTNWTTTNTTFQTAPNAAFHDAPGCVTDSYLNTPSIFIPITFYSSELLFWHMYDLENGHDGGVLEISIEGGPFTDIIAAGGTFANPSGYNGTISTAFLSPIAGRQAWTGTNNSFVVVYLPASIKGHNVVFRFRLATDCAVAGTGWYIDSMQIAYPADPTPTATATFTPTSTPAATATIPPTATPTPSPAPSATQSPVPTPADVLNLSTRMLVQSGDNVGISGFIINGTGDRFVEVRGLGPSLSDHGVPNVLADPILELHGPPGFVTIINDNWRSGSCMGFLAIPPPNDLESCIITGLSPGTYTSIVRGNASTSGVALAEVYAGFGGPLQSERLVNISTRGFVDSGDNIMIAGFILNGSGQNTIVARGIGPSLSMFGIADVLSDPQLELRNNAGTLIRANNDWMDDPVQKALIIAAGLAPTNNLESAIYETLPPGQYTALLSGINSGTGVGLVELYALPP